MPEPTRPKKSILGPGGVVNNPPQSIYTKTEEPKKEEEPAPTPQPIQKRESEDISLVVQTRLGDQYNTEKQKQDFMSFEVNSQPAQRDRRHSEGYLERNYKLNIMIDRRIWPYVNHLLSHAPGLSKGDRLNRILLKTLLDQGYPVDPDILDRPFDSKDVPRPPK